MKPEHKKIFESLVEWQLMGLCIEREASGEPYEGRVAVGTIILERVDHRKWDGQTIKEVVLKPWQFSWTMPEAEKGEPVYYNEAVHIAANWPDEFGKRKSLQECCEIATRMINYSIPRDPELASVHCCEYVNGKYRLMMDSHPEKKCNRWWQKMQIFKVVGRHEFYV